jgi:small subunit ribosomal protein S16
MVKIRLFRTGTRKRPSYRIVAVDSRAKRQGRFLENLGTYNPRSGGAVEMREDALERWVQQGAQVTETVRSLVRKARRARAAEAAESGSGAAGVEESAPSAS